MDLWSDFPKTVIEFEERFASEESCYAYLAKQRWPEGFRCPACGHDKAWELTRRRLMECRACHRQVSVTAGTIFHRSRKPLRLWFKAMLLMTAQRPGISALSLMRQLGLTSYQTAWTWLHKLRRAMVRPGREALMGQVEVDDGYVGGEETGVHGRETKNKAVVAVAVAPTPVRWFALAAEPVTSVDVTAADMLAELDDELHQAGIQLVFAEMKDPVKDKLKRFGLFSRFDERHFFFTLGQVVDAYLDSSGVAWVDWEDR